MILVIDNYDSFAYNLVQAIGTIRKQSEQIVVVRNDQIAVAEIMELNPSHIILSPGPGRPKEAGICEEVIRTYEGQFPILGVCLGHQAICEAYGATITHAKVLMHGKQSRITVHPDCELFGGMEETMVVGRYHSLVASREQLPDELEVVAQTEDGTIMAVKHKKYPIFGVQFHPESILTPLGLKVISNFCEVQKQGRII